MNSTAPYEHGFILSLLILAIGGLIWLFLPFIPALFFSLLIAIATHSQYNKLRIRFSDTVAALLTTLMVTIILILPLGYILLVSGFEITSLIQNIDNNFSLEQINQITTSTISALPISESIKHTLLLSLDTHLDSLLITAKDFSITILKSIASLSSGFLLFLLIVIFSLFYFYIDGQKLVKKIKDLSPLENHLDNILLDSFANLSIALVGSVFIIALLQGLVFSIGVMVVGLPVLYFGIAMALASFIPILGGLIIWLPLSLYLYAQGQMVDAMIIVIFGALLIGTIIDHFIRPIIIKKCSNQANNSSALDHTLLTVLSTLAGIMQFGIMGLFVGPLIAAMAISIFDVYTIKYVDSLDRS